MAPRQRSITGVEIPENGTTADSLVILAIVMSLSLCRFQHLNAHRGQFEKQLLLQEERRPIYPG
jgi:hypothetical protein